MTSLMTDKARLPPESLAGHCAVPVAYLSTPLPYTGACRASCYSTHTACMSVSPMGSTVNPPMRLSETRKYR